MSLSAKRELLVQVFPRYREAGAAQRSLILDEFVQATGYARKYAIRLLNSVPPRSKPGGQRDRVRRYGPRVQEALAIAWAAANYICAKRLIPFLAELVPSLERHGHLDLAEDVREQLLAISAATADRILAKHRHKGRGTSTTKAGKLLKKHVPVRTFADWDEQTPGFVEADLVAHCGSSVHGSFLNSLVLTDIETGWTECLALLCRGQSPVIEGLERARKQLPFPLLGLDTDNGSEFLNAQLIRYCEELEITFTRGRAYRKNDQCFVEQKNGSVVRQLVGYDRYEGEVARRQLAELYQAVRLYVNLFQPSMKLRKKHREGSQVRRTYDAARTPLQRLLATSVLDGDTCRRLEQVRDALDPVRLLQQIQTLQDAFWRHAIVGPAEPEHKKLDVEFDPAACLGVRSRGQESKVDQAAGHQRRFRRTKTQRKALQKPRAWRTRPDAFEGVRDQLLEWFSADPAITGRELLTKLQARHTGYPDKLLRTLQRRVQEWRASMLVEFNASQLEADLLVGAISPPSLRGLQIRRRSSTTELRPVEGCV